MTTEDETVEMGPTHKMVELEDREEVRPRGWIMPESDKCATCGEPADVVRTHLRSSGLVIQVLACGHTHVFHDD